MVEAAKSRADELTENAIAGSPYADFREAYRERLRWLKDHQPQAFTIALSHYNDVLVPNIAKGADPLLEWIDYGQRLGELSGTGETKCIDEVGRARDYAGEPQGLVLHLPVETSVPALALAIPRDLSEPQRATLDLLVRKS